MSVAVLLYRYRRGDATMRPVWLCSRIAAIGNIAVMLAALGVFGSGSGSPDFAVAAVMGVLGVLAAKTVNGQASGELRSARPQAIAAD